MGEVEMERRAEAERIRRALAGLEAEAKKAGLPFLAHLINMAAIEAKSEANRR